VTRFGELAHDRLQVLLLGPGYGESVLVRVPGKPPGWMVVDSLLAKRRGQTWCGPLRALEELDAEPDLVLLTHSHLDHVAGMTLLVERFGHRAAFGALDDVELGHVASAKVRESAQRAEAGAALRAIAGLPSDNRWDLHAGPQPLGEGRVTVLHPSASRLRELQKLRSIGPNQLSAAVLVEWQQRTVLLGADLERPEWALLADGRRLHLCDPVKVPHHGSEGAFDHVWAARNNSPENARRRMLVAPFDKSPKLPDLDDADGLPRLLGEVDAVHLTCVPFQTVPPAAGTLRLGELRTARDAAREAQPPMPTVLGEPTAPQAPPRHQDAWLLAELAADGRCLVRGGPAHVTVTR
jgi:Metallo-beta-lactamase superfamily